jgi:acyl-CoA thioesterase-1
MLTAGCGAPAEVERGRPAATTAERSAVPATEAASSGSSNRFTGAERRVVFLGDSLTAGLGLPIEEAYPSVIERRLQARDQGWSVMNAGVSGDTSAGGRRRLDWALEGGAAVVVVALGANDGLRGLPVDDLARNLDAIVTAAKVRGAAVLLAGMEAPPNTGPDYSRQFREVYPAVAARHQVTLLPFLLDGVAGETDLNQADGIHPNREGARRVAEVVWRVLEPVIEARERTTTE